MWPFKSKSKPALLPTANDRLPQGLYHFRVAPFVHPGIGNLVFEPKFGNPLFMVAGPSQPVQGQLSPVSTSPVLSAQFGFRVNGLGGLVSGQIVSQPLTKGGKS
jgi:hypothetical protein